MDEKPGGPFQFGLKWVFVAVFAVSIVAWLFRWLDAELAVITLLLAILVAPIARYTDWPDALKTLAWVGGWLAILAAVLFAGCVACFSDGFQH